MQPKLTAPSQTIKTKIPCPVPKEFCKTSTTIDRDGISYVGYTVPNNIPIFSIIEGVIRAGVSGGGKYEIPGHPFILLENPNPISTSFSYEYFGSYTTPSASLFEISTEIGKVKNAPEQWMSLYNNANLIIRAEQNNKLIPLRSEDIE